MASSIAAWSAFLEAFLRLVGVPTEEMLEHWTVVVSGGHHSAFDAVCDELTLGPGAERAVITGAGHEVQMTADPFNEALLCLWRSAAS